VRVGKGFLGFGEGDSVVSAIGGGFGLIPLEVHGSLKKYQRFQMEQGVS
jgi:hypothetical protein